MRVALGGFAERAGVVPDLVEEGAQGGDHAGALEQHGALAGVLGVDRDDGGGVVDDDHAQRQGGRGADGAAEAVQPAGVLHGGGVVADAVLVDGAHPDAAFQGLLVEGAAGLHDLGGLRAAGGEGEHFGGGVGGELDEPVADLVEAGEHLDAALFAGGVQVGVLGDQAGHGGAAAFHLALAAGGLGLLVGEQGGEAAFGVDGAPAGAAAGGAGEGEVGEAVEGSEDLALGGVEVGGEAAGVEVGVQQHRPVDGFAEGVEPDRAAGGQRSVFRASRPLPVRVALFISALPRAPGRGAPPRVSC